jgi:peptide/nickel transport system substrate-binding protein
MRAWKKGLGAATACAVAGALALAACGTGSGNAGLKQKNMAARSNRFAYTPGSYGTLPKKHGTPKHGGTITVAQLSTSTPDYIFPITPGADLSVYTADFEDYFWRPLIWSPNGDSVPTIDWKDSVAKSIKFSNKNKTATIVLNKYRWSNGKPVTSTDVKFDYMLFKAAITLSPANEGDYTPGLYPDNVSAFLTPKPNTVVIKFKHTYNKYFVLYTQLGLLTPLPATAWAKTSSNGKILPESAWSKWTTACVKAKSCPSENIYNFLTSASVPKDFTSSPLWKTVDGPFQLKSFDVADGTFSLKPNSKYSGHKPYASTVTYHTYQSTSSEFTALQDNQLDVGFVDASDLPAVGSIKSHYNVWGYPNFGWSYVVYNFKDKTNAFDKIIGEQYIRTALAHLQNESVEIKSRGIWGGAADPAYGPVPSVPRSPLAPSNATKNPYPFSIKAAKKLLTTHGWKVNPHGTSTCQKAGNKKGDCGAGIPKGAKLAWTLYYGTQPNAILGMDTAWASNASSVGIKMSLVGKSFNYMISNLNDVSAPQNDNKWAMEDFGGFTGIEYPTTNEVFNTAGSFNIGGFSNKSVDKAIHNSIYSLSDQAVKTEAGLVGKIMPGLFQPNPDLIFAFSKNISSAPQYFSNQSQYTQNPEYWYIIKKK